MQREGREESEEASSPDMRESTLHGDCSAKSDATLQWYEIGSYGRFSPLPPALGVTRTSD